ncbi:MAG TPA: addiction module antitoxin RelB [bacterium]|nr:addiction module antitoxin RelB [bacterium]
MTKKAEEIVTEALALSPAVRAYVAEKLIESLDLPPAMELSSEWKEEILKRCKDMDEEQVALHDAEAVFMKAFATLE